MIRSSYLQNDLNYGELITCITKCTSPKKIVEIGILDGYSLTNFIGGSGNETKIYAYDIFDNFNGNHANKEFIINKFSKNDNVVIDDGDFYKLHEIIDNDIDILHIDIANDGDVFEFVINNYYKKMSKNGIIIFEGGNIKRDNVEWMNKYNKTKINPIIQKFKQEGYDINVFGTFPSLTLIKK